MLEVSTVRRFQNGICIEIFQKKFKQGSWGHNFLKETLGIFRFVTLPLEIPDKMKLHPWKFYKIVTSIEILGQKLRPMEIPHNLFWITLGDSISFLLTPGISTFYFFNNSGNSMSSTSPVSMFPWIAHIMKKWEQLQLNVNNSKSKEGQGDY